MSFGFGTQVPAAAPLRRPHLGNNLETLTALGPQITTAHTTRIHTQQPFPTPWLDSQTWAACLSRVDSYTCTTQGQKP